MNLFINWHHYKIINKKINLQNENIDFNETNKNIQEISYKRFNNKNNSNFESTFIQAFRTFKNDPLPPEINFK